MARWSTHRSDANAEDLYAAARKLGMSIEVIQRPVDAIGGAYGFTVAIEVKTKKGALEPDQVRFFDEFRGAKVIWRTLEDVQATHNNLRLQAIRLAVP